MRSILYSMSFNSLPAYSCAVNSRMMPATRQMPIIYYAGMRPLPVASMSAVATIEAVPPNTT